MKLYFGCGKHRLDGFVGIDRVKTDAVDIVHDMNRYPYPFETGSVTEMILYNILEHLPNTIAVMEELWRISADGAILRILVPYYNSPGMAQDPTHVSFFTESTFDYFTVTGTTPLSHFNYYSKARFEIVSIVPDQKKMLNLLPRRIQWFLGHHLATIHSLSVVLRAVKGNG